MSWKMKNTAIVMTTNVWRRTRSAIRPNGIARIAPSSPVSGSSAKTMDPVRCQSWVAIPMKYAPLPKNAACPSEM